jgi:hypothetical protein
MSWWSNDGFQLALLGVFWTLFIKWWRNIKQVWWLFSVQLHFRTTWMQMKQTLPVHEITERDDTVRRHVSNRNVIFWCIKVLKGAIQAPVICMITIPPVFAYILCLLHSSRGCFVKGENVVCTFVSIVWEVRGEHVGNLWFSATGFARF